MDQKARDAARCLARIRRSAKLEIKAESRRQRRYDARWHNPMQHPKWRKAKIAEIERKVATEWHMHGTSPAAALSNLLDEAYGVYSPF